MQTIAFRELVRFAHLLEQWTGYPEAGGLRLCIAINFQNVHGFRSDVFYQASYAQNFKKLWLLQYFATLRLKKTTF